MCWLDKPKEKESEAEIEHVRYLKLKPEELILTSILPGRDLPCFGGNQTAGR